MTTWETSLTIRADGGDHQVSGPPVEIVEPKEWSIWIGSRCYGFVRNNRGGWSFVHRYPDPCGGLVNTFTPLWGCNRYD